MNERSFSRNNNPPNISEIEADTDNLSDTEEMEDDDEEDDDDTDDVSPIRPSQPPAILRRTRHRLISGHFGNSSDDFSEDDADDSTWQEPHESSSSSSVESREEGITSSEDETDSEEEGRVSHNNDISMRDDDDSDSQLTVSSNEEESRESVQSVRLESSTLATIVNPSAPSSSSNQGGIPVTESALLFNAPSSSTSTSKSPDKMGSSETASSSAVVELEDDSQTCPICFESWSSAGEHRIVSLKCGHLFGRKCIERWLKGQGGKCPQCNTKAMKKDIRVIYARCLKPEDTTESVRLGEEIDKLKKEKAQFEKEKAHLKMKNAVDSQLIKNLQQQLLMIKESVSSSHGSVQTQNRDSTCIPRRNKLAMFQALELPNKNGSCRVMAFNEWMNMLVVSMSSQLLDLFPGFGIKKINTLDFKVENYLPLHSKQIRDLQFNPNQRDLLLSVGIDKVAKITNMSSNSTVVSYTTKYPLWCCCWNSCKSCEFFAGTSAGSIYHFDCVQNTNGPITAYQISGSGPVVSISYVPFDHSKDFHLAGLVVTRLTSVSFLELLENGIKEHNLPIEGSFSHTAFDPVSRHLLATCRPTDRNPHARHILCELKVINVSDDPATISNVVSVHQVFYFQGSTTMKVLSRACLTSSGLSNAKNENNYPVVIFSEESTKSLKLYDATTASQTQIIKTNSHVIDILPVHGSEARYVAMLSEKSLVLYKWIEQLSGRQ